MPKVVIQVAKHDDAAIDAQGRKFAMKIYDTSGTKYTVPKTMQGLFQDGGWYEIFWEESSYRGSQPFKLIQSANPTKPMTTSTAVLRGPDTSQAHAKDIQIWCNSMLQRAIDSGKVDAWNEDACVELCEIQKRVFGRVFLGEEAQEAPQTNSGQRFGPGEKLLSPQSAAHPDSARDMDDEIPF